MGRKRQDRTIEEWLNHGESLLIIMGEKHKLYKTIQSLLSRLTSNTHEESKRKVTELLNSHKNELGKNWLSWAKKIKQKAKDENRSKFHVNNNIYDQILCFIGLSRESKKLKKIGDDKMFEILFQHINSFGVNNVDEMYSLTEELKKFSLATNERHSKDKLLSDKKYSGNTNKIIHAIISELKSNKISSFEKLKTIRKDIRNEKIDELKMEIKRLKKKLLIRK